MVERGGRRAIRERVDPHRDVARRPIADEHHVVLAEKRDVRDGRRVAVVPNARAGRRVEALDVRAIGQDRIGPVRDAPNVGARRRLRVGRQDAHRVGVGPGVAVGRRRAELEHNHPRARRTHVDARIGRRGAGEALGVVQLAEGVARHLVHDERVPVGGVVREGLGKVGVHRRRRDQVVQVLRDRTPRPVDEPGGRDVAVVPAARDERPGRHVDVRVARIPIKDRRTRHQSTRANVPRFMPRAPSVSWNP